jgi:integrase
LRNTLRHNGFSIVGLLLTISARLTQAHGLVWVTVGVKVWARKSNGKHGPDRALFMARTIGRLTDLNVRRANKPRLYPDGGGLYLQIARNGSKSWIFRYGPQGRRYHGLGPLHAVSLSEARERARACRQLILAGGDPIDARRQRDVATKLEAAKAITFSEAAERYVKAHGAAWRNARHRQQWASTIRDYAEPVLGRLPIGAVDTAMVMKVLEPIWTRLPETASRLRMRIERILAWATVQGFRAGENPARWRDHLDHLLPSPEKIARVRHHPAMPYAEVPTFLAALRERPGLAARMLEFVILTSARTSEAVGATFDEIDLRRGIWTIPADRMKGGREHRVPLSDRAIAILREIPHSGDRVFPLGDKSMLKLLARMGHRGTTVHGFRSSFRDWAAERTNYPREAVEAALAHVLGDQTETAYFRSDLFDRRKQLMAAWADYCGTPQPEQVADVVTLRRGR